MLPEGSILEKVLLPRYDKNKKLLSLLKCEEMTLVSSDVVSGKTVLLESYNPDKSTKGRLALAKAVYNQAKSLLRADEAVVITSERVIAEGTGLVFSVDRHKGFLSGPATTTISNPPSTAMNSTSPVLRATALLGASLLPLAAQAPALPAPELPADAASLATEAADATRKARNDLRSILQASEDANKATAKFLEEADLLAANDSAPTPEPQLQVPDFKPDPEATVINCQGGIYLDPDLTETTAVLVYLKGVVVKNPQIDLKGANELKVFFERKAKAPQKAANDSTAELKESAKQDAKNFGGVDLGDPRKIVATGAVAIELKPKNGGEPTLASGRYFSYDLLTGDIVIRGGNAWIIQDGKQLRAKDPDAGIYIKKDLTFSTDNAPFEQIIRLPKQ